MDTHIMCCVCLVTQSCPTLCDPMDCSPPGASVHGVSPGKNTGVGFHALHLKAHVAIGYSEFSQSADK